ncbi:MAG: bacterial Ig-like domain-containing protein, partial [Treponema sp.]|nr:bacterial Ig-like domain-containing protein [Treponema sp.]
MNLKKLFYLGAAILAFAVVFTACSGGDDSGPGKKTIVNVAITPPVKTQYTDEDTALDLTGLEVTVTFSDGSGITFSGSDVTVTGFTPGTEGEQTITVTYNKNGITFEKSFTVNVSAAGAATMLNLTVVLTTGDGKLT